MLGKFVVALVAMLSVAAQEQGAPQPPREANPNYPRSMEQSVQRHPRAGKPLPPPWFKKTK